MLMMPISNPKGRDAVVIVLDPSNIERLKKHDPVEILSFGGKVLHNPRIFICYEEDSPELNRLVQSGDHGKLLDFLGRGFEFHPELGDHDRGPESVHGQN